MREKCSHFDRSHLLRVTLAVEQHEAFDPGDARLLAPVCQMFDSARICDLVEKPGFVGAARSRRRRNGSLRIKP